MVANTLRIGSLLMLVLCSAACSATRPDAQPAPLGRTSVSTALPDTKWVVTGLITPDTLTWSQALERAKPTLTIANDGAVHGTTGCNNLTGHARIHPTTHPTGSDITFQLGTTRMACDPAVMDLEKSLLQALTGTVHATTESDTLTLTNPTGHGLTLQAPRQ